MHSFVLVSNNTAQQSELAKHSVTAECTSEDFSINVLKQNRDIACIIDFNSSGMAVQYESLIKEIVTANLPCIGICSEIQSLNKTLIRYGITAVFRPSQYHYIPLFFKQYTPTITGTIALIDNNVFNTYGLSTVIQAFGYKAIVVDSLEACCDIHNVMDMVCINCSQVSTHEIATKYVAGKLPKKNALVLYKSEESDIFIHDIIKLHRIAKVIYTLEEVYALLVQLMFRQQLHSLLYSLYETSDMQRSTTAYKGSLRQLYLETGMEIFALPAITHTEAIELFRDNTERMHTILAKAAGFSWLSDNE
ncbi:MAG: hypothetical protein QHH74_11695 [Spirochaetota bacterium]|nr:hypothetical protein [Spirochaetota bacterium]